jgi:hypothetical protein
MVSGQSLYDVTRLIAQNEQPASTPQRHFAAVATLVAVIGQNKYSLYGNHISAPQEALFFYINGGADVRYDDRGNSSNGHKSAATN